MCLCWKKKNSVLSLLIVEEKNNTLDEILFQCVILVWHEELVYFKLPSCGT